MSIIPYYARYCTFKTLSKESGGYLLSADSLIGDLFEISFEMVDSRQTAVLINRFGHKVGYFERDITHQLLLYQADNWDIHAVLSAVFFTEFEKSGYYWGEVALVCYAKRYSDEFDVFLDAICKQLRKGKRPRVDLGPNSVEKVLNADFEMILKERGPKRDLPSRTVTVKDYLKYDERLIEMARRKNIGCMIIGWAFIFVLVAFAIYVLWLILPFW